MNATEYLRSLQSRAEIGPSQIDDIIKYRSEQFGYEAIVRALSRYPVDTLEGQEKFYRDMIVAPFLDTLPDEASKSLKDVLIGLLPTYDPNACAIHVPNDGPLIVLHTELLAAISFYNELQLLAGKQLIDGQIDLGADLLNEGHCFIVDCFRENRSTKYPLLPTTLTPEELFFIQLKTMANELFIVVHELAHIYLGHLSTFKSESIGTGDKRVSIHRFNRDQQMELDADVQAVTWLTNLYDKDIENPFIRLTSKSIGIAIEVFMLFHMVEVNLAVKSETSSHPSSRIRLNHILEKCGSLFMHEDKEFVAEMIHNASDIESFKVRF